MIFLPQVNVLSDSKRLTPCSCIRDIVDTYGIVETYVMFCKRHEPFMLNILCL